MTGTVVMNAMTNSTDLARDTIASFTVSGSQVRSRSDRETSVASQAELDRESKPHWNGGKPKPAECLSHSRQRLTHVSRANSSRSHSNNLPQSVALSPVDIWN